MLTHTKSKFLSFILKSGKATEHVFIPQKIADRLKQYILEKGFGPDDRIPPMTYASARAMVVMAGNRVVIACDDLSESVSGIDRHMQVIV